MSIKHELLWANKIKFAELLKASTKFEEIDDKEYVSSLLTNITKAFTYEVESENGKYNLWDNAINAVLNLPRNLDDNSLYYATLLKDVGMAYEKTEYYDSETDEKKYHITNVAEKSIDLTSNEMYQLVDYGAYHRYLYYIEYASDEVSFDKNYIRKHIELKRDYEDFQNLMRLKIAYGKLYDDGKTDLYEALAGDEGKKMWDETVDEYYGRLESRHGIRLKQIRTEDIEYDSHDRTMTCLTLDDYDWMNYSLDIYFHTKNQGYFNIRINYNGSTNCFMHVTQELDNMIYYYHYEFGIDIYEKYIIKFLKNHIKHWDSSYAFSGEDVSIEFFNEIIKKGELVKSSPRSFTDIDYKCCNGGIGKVIWKKKELV